MTPELLYALGLAFTGEPLGASATASEPSTTAPEPVEGALRPGEPTTATITEWFTSHGWPPERLAALRAQRQAEQRPWPFEVSVDVIRPIGFARYLAAQKQARAELGLDGLHPTVHQGPKVIGPAEQRLLAERPPHHGNVG